MTAKPHTRSGAAGKGKPVIVQLLGGLGNQMFQYALGRALSLRNGSALMVDTSLLRHGNHLTVRGYDLDIFDFEASRATRADVWRYHPHGAGLTSKIAFHIRRRICGENANIERGFRFDPSVLSLQAPLYLVGTWQSPKYFAGHEDILRSDFRFRHQLPARVAEVAREVARPGSVCLHVRRGDYVSVPDNAKTIGFVGQEYYTRAVERIRDTNSNPRFFVFSDDIAWCRENLSLGPDAWFVQFAAFAGMKAYAVDLQLMSMAENFIIANSTFSWWAAWLAGARARQVITPRDWFRASHLSADDLIPVDWERI